MLSCVIASTHARLRLVVRPPSFFGLVELIGGECKTQSAVGVGSPDEHLQRRNRLRATGQPEK